MVSTFTPNIQLQEPAAGDQVGTWGTVTVNPNMTLVDLVVGGNATIGLNNSNVILTSAQFQARMITFNSTLTGSVTITFPTSFTKDYKIRNLCTGSSAFTITLETTSGGQVIGCPPGDTVDVYNDGSNLFYTNLERVGTYWDYAGSSVPAWISACTVPPWLNCNAGSFSSATYPQLTVILQGTTLPDARGNVRVTLNQGTGRVTSGIAGLDGNTIFSVGGNQSLHQHLHANTLIDNGHTHALNGGSGNQGLQSFTGGPVNTGGTGSGASNVALSIGSAVTGIVINNNFAGSGASQNVQPSYIAGITMIRAA